MAGTNPPSSFLGCSKIAVAAHPAAKSPTTRPPQADAAIWQRCSCLRRLRLQFDEGRGNVDWKDCGCCSVAVSRCRCAPTAGATSYTQTLPVGCIAPTLSGDDRLLQWLLVVHHRRLPVRVTARTRRAGRRLHHLLREPQLHGLYWVPLESGQGYTLTMRPTASFFLRTFTTRTARRSGCRCSRNWTIPATMSATS